MKRILFVYLYCNLGGVATVIKQRMAGLSRAGWEVHAVFKQDNGGAEDLLSSGVRRVEIVGESFVEEVQRHTESGLYDLVTIFDDPSALQAAQALSGKVVYEIHTPIERVVRNNDARVLAGCAKVIVPSVWSKNWILGYFPEVNPDRVQVCANIVDPTPFSGAPVPFPRFLPGELLWVGKLAKYKNWREALRIGSTLLGREVISRMTCITGGNVAQESVKELLTEVANLRMTGQLRWLHDLPYDRIASAYRNAAAGGSVLLSCSLGESFCYVVHEAMHAGLPVVATRVGAVTDVVIDGETGDLYDPGDYERAADLVERLVRFPMDARRRSSGARSLVQSRYQVSALQEKYLSTLESLL